MDDEKAVVVAASSAVAAAIALYAAVAGRALPPMLESASYASWFEDDLRCTRKTFLQTSIFLQKHEIGFAGAKFKEHSYNNKKTLPRQRGGRCYRDVKKLCDGDQYRGRSCT
ncbi:hypothetical protein GQ600_23259 [Phytophthora cactorum]|nr:hypothetical protein GQ600_23259 [Phytophthora cactorum]